jgi:hypothetical protein
MVEEYAHYSKMKECKKAEEFNRIFRLRNDQRLIHDYPPCFFVGNIKRHGKFCLFGLNPALNERANRRELEIYNEKGWEETYLTFFRWMYDEKLPNRYYSRLAVLLAGLVGAERIPDDRKARFDLLAENLVSLDLIPYHSRAFNLCMKAEKYGELLRPYLKNLRQLIGLCRPRLLLINGAAFKPVQEEIDFEEESPSVDVNVRLEARVGKCCGTSAVWFDKFINSRYVHATNRELFCAGENIRSRLKL